MTTMIGPLARAVAVGPERCAVHCGEVELSYGQMWERAGRLVGALHGLGVGVGDRVAVVGPNCHRYLELYQAIPGAGMVLVPLTQRHTAAELGYALQDSGAKVLFAAAGVDYPDGLVEHAFDRAKDMIVSGGENVYSTEVEEALYRHPAVLEAAVFGIPDERWGEVVHAVVVPREDVTEAELLGHCRELIAGYKLPKAIELRSEPLPKSGAGKVLKRELRAPFWEGRRTMVAGA
jgi:acyl-CoA synthetase (AMP-forming)/AMP-acid ligase II